MLVTGSNAWGAKLPAKFGKTLTIDQWGNISANQFEGYSDDATVVFEYKATQASGKTGHISSFGHGEGDEATYLFYGDITPTKAGYNRLVKKISDIKSAFTDENAVNSYGNHGLTFNTWGEIVSDKSVTVYEQGVGAPAEEGHWNSSTNTYTWTLGYSNLMSIFTFSEGELANYDQIHLNFTWTGEGDYNNAFRLVFQDGSGNTLGSQITFGSAGQKDITFATHGSTSSIDLSQVAKILIGGASNSGSVTIDPSSVYLTTASSTVTFDAPAVYGCPLPSDAITAKIKDGAEITSGSSVPNGTTVVFTAKKYSGNSESGPVGAGRLVLNGWQINDDDVVTTDIETSGIVWAGSTATLEYVINDDIAMHAQYGLSYVCDVQAATGGTAQAKIGETTLNSNSGFRANSEIILEATPNTGYRFKCWKGELYGAGSEPVWTKENWSTDANFTFTVTGATFDNAWGNDIKITPVFEVDILKIGKPECNHYGDRTHGDNYFDIQRLNPLNGVTIGVADNGVGRKINVPTTGGAVKFVFDNAYNLACLVGWTISENEALRARVAAVEFYTDEECITRVADFWSGAGERSGINDNRLNNNIKAIKISFKEGEAASYDIEWIRFSFEHRDNQLPVLTEGTSPEMIIYTGETLKITNTPGYWRQYPDNTYTEPTYESINGVQITSTTYSSVFTKENMQNGDYYFGARDGVWCSLGYNHGQTGLVPIHVQVTNPPTDLKVVYDLNGGSGSVPTDPNTYNYKDNATILAPGNIAKEGHFFSHWSLNPDGSGDKYSTDSEKGNTTVVVNKKELRLYAVWEKLGFAGWFNFENRLIAQWNFDLSDEVRLNLPTLDKNTTYWTKTEPKTNEILYTYTGGALNYDQLTYDGTHVIPMAAGLKFKASGTGTEVVKILVTKKDGKIENVQFCLDNGVKLDVPYVRNSYRNDKGSDYAPYQWEGPVENPTWNYFDPGTSTTNEGFVNFQDCLHHLNRDIVYVVSDPDILTYGADRPITNLCADGTKPSLELFNNGGDENVKGLPDGVHKTWRKCNFTGTQGDRCIIEFSKPIKIDRIAVNRNLVYSFYTENTAVTTDGKYDKPFPGMRLIGSPQGQRVANVGGTWTEYTGAIAVTFGGWPYNGNQYKDGTGADKTDTWGDLNVYQGKHTNINDGAELEGNHDYSVDYSKIDITKVPFATDGFPVYSRLENFAYNENVNPSATATKYHDQYNGGFLLDSNDGGSNSYLVNYNPWTLPCRGAYVKFEPTLPGVLNVDLLQDGGATYYISDEFGHLVKENVYTKVGQTYQKIDGTGNTAGHFKVTDKSYVKYSFNVYPGKTYYIFSNDGGMGISGFYFEPYVYRKYNSKPSTTYAEEDFELSRINVGIKTAEMTAGPKFSWTDTTSDAMDYTNQAAHTNVTVLVNPTNEKNVRHEDTSVNLNPASGEFAAIPKNTNPHIVNNVNDINYVTLDNKAVHVTLNREFTANKWQTIVLPYSMNNLQMQQVFGEGTKVVTLRDVQKYDVDPSHQTTAYFVYHMNQDILAGYPYLIYPTKNVDNVVSNAYLDTDESNIYSTWSSAPNNVTISGVGPNIVTYNGTNYDGLGVYDFTSTYTYNTVDIPAGSYVMSNNQLTRLPDKQKAAPFRAYLSYSGDPSKAKDYMITATSLGELEDELGGIDGIENILLESGIVGAKTDIYNINGQMVRQHTDDLNGLPKGMYIVNGKKFIVK